MKGVKPKGKKPESYRLQELIEHCVRCPRRHAKRDNDQAHFGNLLGVWRAMSSFLDDNMSTGKGVLLGDYGAFTWKLLETPVSVGTKRYHREPVLILKEDFIVDNVLRFTDQNIYRQTKLDGNIFEQTPFVPMIPLNYNTLAYNTGLDRDTLKRYLDDILMDWTDLIRDGEEVTLDFGVAVISTKRCVISVAYNNDFCARNCEKPGDYRPLQFQHLVTERLDNSVVVDITTKRGTELRTQRELSATTAPPPPPSLDANAVFALEKIVAGLEAMDNEILRRIAPSSAMEQLFTGFHMKQEYIDHLTSMLTVHNIAIREERPPESFREHVRGACTYFRMTKNGLSFVVTIALAEPHCSFQFWKRGGHTPLNANATRR